MRLLWNGVMKDLRRFLRDPLALALWLAMPLGIGIAITLATGGSSGPAPNAKILIVDEDQSFLSDMLAKAFNQAGEIFKAERVERKEGRQRLEKGDGSALLIIAKGFGDAVLAEKPFNLELITNPEQRILPQMVEQLLLVLRQGVFYLHRVAGTELKAMSAGPPDGQTFPDADVARISVTINQTVQRLQNYLYPPAILLETSQSASPQTKLNISLLFLPGILLMSLLFMAQGLSDDFWKEKQQGTLKRWIGTPAGPLPFLAAKLLSAAVLIFFISLIILAIGMAYHAVPFQRLPLALVWSTFAGLVFLALMQLIQLYASSQRGGAILTMSIVFPLLMLGGSLFPFELMPAWMAALGRWTPNGWTLELLKDILLGKWNPNVLLTALPILTLIAVAGIILAARRIPTFARN